MQPCHVPVRCRAMSRYMAMCGTLSWCVAMSPGHVPVCGFVLVRCPVLVRGHGPLSRGCLPTQITKVMLLKGWRCVECIVCEVCGKASDPSRLLLCDDCDISYHTYCLDPPLQTVPKGGWKCKWCGRVPGARGEGCAGQMLRARAPARCVCCVQCGAASPGFHCEWQNNYTHCAPCASLVVCPVCREKYVEDDLLIQCRHCER
uniref:PHD-type domain-containing protein n=1 Tax=Nothoprocta perdicaria TaxID=30464 RepID=A0A8C6YTC7_NOTPE